MKRKLFAIPAITGAVLGVFATPAIAQEGPAVAPQVLLDNIWVFIAGILVFLMQAGFAMLETGLTRSKNAGNIMMKNLMDTAAGVVSFFIVGYGIAYGATETLGGFLGWGGIGVDGIDSTGGDEGLFTSTDFFFQAAFAATAATIVGGAMAERTKFKAYFVYSIVLTAIIYPIVVRWTWGGGWLAQREYPFSDFAGSTIVHGTGGWAALMGAIILGPRIGKFTKDGKPRAIPGHNIAFVLLGTMILFVGWFGFNPGSELAVDEFVMQVGVKTLMSACAGAIVAMLVNWIWDGKPEVSMACNGLLAGLVAITAPVGTVTTPISLLIGAVGGALVVCSVKFFDKMKVDDPVGAISVHGVVGVWGTMSIGLFAKWNDGFIEEDMGLFYGGGINQLVTQGTMVIVHFVFVCVTTGLLFLAIKSTIGLRVSPEEEIAGLDVEEHGSHGYGLDTVTGLPTDDLVLAGLSTSTK